MNIVEKIIDKIINLVFDLKSILTLSMTGAFIYLAVTKVITVESFMVIFGMVIGWYFTKKKEPDTLTSETKTVSTTEVK